MLQTKILQPRKLTVACFQKLRVVLKQTERSLELALSAACFFQGNIRIGLYLVQGIHLTGSQTMVWFENRPILYILT